MPLPNGDVLSGRRDAVDQIAGVGACRERYRRFDLGVFGKTFCVRQVEGAAAFVKTVCSLTGLIQAIADAVSIADEEAGRIDKDFFSVRRFDLETPDHRAGERFLDRLFLLRVSGRTVIVIRLHEQDLVSSPFEYDQLGRAQLITIKPDRVRT